MKTALIDASSAILLYKAQMFDAVAWAYRLQVVPAVFGEITVPNRTGASAFRRALHRRRILQLNNLPDAGAVRRMRSMGIGERDTVAAYAQGASDFIIIDDGKGAQACRANDIPHINALLCPKILYLTGHIEASLFESAFYHLQRIGRYSARVIEYAQTCTPDKLMDFFPRPLPSSKKEGIL